MPWGWMAQGITILTIKFSKGETIMNVITSSSQVPKRNDLCFCGSGKKYKKCCELKEGKCGDCSLCCSVFSLPFIGKEANVMCKFHKGGVGCTIHDSPERHSVCSSFGCFWLRFGNRLQLRPDIAGYVLCGADDIVQVVTRDHQQVSLEVQVALNNHIRTFLPLCFVLFPTGIFAPPSYTGTSDELAEHISRVTGHYADDIGVDRAALAA